MLFGVSSYSFCQAVQQGRMTTFQIVDTAARMGFDAIDFAVLQLDGKTIEEAAPLLARQCRDAGIQVKNYAVGADFLLHPVSQEVERLKREVDAAAVLGAKTLRHDATSGIPKGFAGPRGFADVVDRIAEGYRAVTEYAQAAGIRTMVENHGFFCQDSDRVELLLNRVDHPNFGLLLDIGNFLCVDEDPLKAVGRLAPYAFHVHAKDFHVKPAWAVDPGAGWFRSRGGAYLRGAIVGHGEVPVQAALQLIRAAGYDDVVALEFEGLEACEQGVALGLENLRRFTA